jgi:hypothetical protein
MRWHCIPTRRQSGPRPKPWRQTPLHVSAVAKQVNCAGRGFDDDLATLHPTKLLAYWAGFIKFQKKYPIHRILIPVRRITVEVAAQAAENTL